MHYRFDKRQTHKIYLYRVYKITDCYSKNKKFYKNAKCLLFTHAIQWCAKVATNANPEQILN